MSGVDELKKFKEILDAGLITEEEFEKKKKEILFGIVQLKFTEVEPKEKHEKVQKKSTNEKLLYGVLIVIAITLMLFLGINIADGKSKQLKRVAMLEMAVGDILDDYGLSVYTVKYVDNSSYEVFAEGFESLTNKEKLSCLEKLDKVSVNDPCGDGKIDLGKAKVHPGLDVKYSYWRVSSMMASLYDIYGVGYEKAGIYSDEKGKDICVFECEN